MPTTVMFSSCFYWLQLRKSTWYLERVTFVKVLTAYVDIKFIKLESLMKLKGQTQCFHYQMKKVADINSKY